MHVLSQRDFFYMSTIINWYYLKVHNTRTLVAGDSSLGPINDRVDRSKERHTKNRFDVTVQNF